MRPLVFHTPIAEVLFWASLALWIAIERWVRIRTDAQGHTAWEWTYPLVNLILVASLLGSIEAARQRLAPLPGPPWWPVAAGLILMWTAVAFRLWAVFTLGNFFKVMVVIQENHRVIDHGPYRWLRHPSYLGALGTTVGLGLAEGDWVSVAIMLVGPLIGILIRIRNEERLLLRELGTEYADYVRRTARLVPGVF